MEEEILKEVIFEYAVENANLRIERCQEKKKNKVMKERLDNLEKVNDDELQTNE